MSQPDRTADDVTDDDFDPDCVFCQRIENNDVEQFYAEIVARFTPLNPITPGHMLFLPCWHAVHPCTEAIRAAMSYAETYAATQGQDYNLITSSGPAATQTIAHLHVHYVPRRPGDGLQLPWSTAPAAST